MDNVVLNQIEEEQDSGIWLSIGDLMSGLLLIFALLFIAVLLQLQTYAHETQERRRVIIGTLIEELRGNDIEVVPNQETGDISIRDAILFDEDSWVLKPDGERFLRKFIPVYSKVIFSRQVFDEEITRVIIEGYASSKGNEMHNMDLSLKRASSVVNFILDKLSFETKTKLTKKIVASGRGEAEAKQTYDDPEDRKVLFRFQFRGEEFVSWLKKLSRIEK